MSRTLLTPVLSYLREWDYVAGQRADYILSNSSEIKRRVAKYYRRESEVLYPFVDFTRFNKETKPAIELPESYFVVMSRLVEWKRLDLAIHACNNLNRSLLVVGDGSHIDQLKKMSGPSVQFTGFLSESEATYVLRRAEALIHPQKEDFGMTVVEANHVGTPVIAYQAGGALETVIPSKTGEFFDVQEVDSLAHVIESFDSSRYTSEDMRTNADMFSRKVFEDAWTNFIATIQ